MQLKRRIRKGFTLIELLVVILILAILAAMIVPRVMTRPDDAKRAKAASDLAALSSSLNQFRLDVGRFPTTEEGLESLRTAPSDANGWRGPYTMKALPTDPWGGEYVYTFPGADGDDSYGLSSYGADMAPGGEGNNADILESE